MINIFMPQNLVLTITALINLVMGIFVLIRSNKSKVNLYFSLMTFANFFWASSLVLFNLSNSQEMLRFFASLPYTFAFLVIVFLFYFSLSFPYQSFTLPKFLKWLLNFIVVVISFYTTFFYKLFVLRAVIKPGHIADYNVLAYSIYAVFLVLLVVAALGFLFYKYRLADGIFKWQLLVILGGVFLGVVFGSYFNLFLMYSDNFNYVHIGPLFTLFINFIVLGFIVMPKDKLKT